MKPFIPLLASLLFSVSCGIGQNYEPKNGDIIFQTSQSRQSLAIQNATRSPYSHMGIVYIRDGKPFVFEAVEPVHSTPLQAWIDRGEGKHFVVRRLKNAAEALTREALDRMLEEGKPFEGRHYDLVFEWTDEKLYCSELVWKIYNRALGLEIGKLQTISEFDLSDPAVQGKIRERWGGSPPPDQIVISPVAIFENDLLVTVYEQ
jgi:uncharacterized protein YycO